MLLVVESMDVVFAVDSIPAVFGISTDTFIVYTSNVFAILGLRALYFLLANLLGMFRYLHVGLALVLVFVELKMLLEEPLRIPLESLGLGKQHLILLSLGMIAAILSVTIILSIFAEPKEPLEHQPFGHSRVASLASIRLHLFVRQDGEARRAPDDRASSRTARPARNSWRNTHWVHR